VGGHTKREVVSSQRRERSERAGVGRGGGPTTKVKDVHISHAYLGIDNLCDENLGRRRREPRPRPAWAIRSNVVASQVTIHREWGGVVPELASRQHIRDICGVVGRALHEADVTWPDLGADCRDARPRPRGIAARRRVVRERRRRGGGLPLVPCIILPATSSRWCSRTANYPCRPLFSVVRRHTSLYLVDGPGSINV